MAKSKKGGAGPGAVSSKPTRKRQPHFKKMTSDGGPVSVNTEKDEEKLTPRGNPRQPRTRARKSNP